MTKQNGKKRYMLLFICILLAILAWFAVKMSQTYTQSYNFVIRFTNLPDNKQLLFQSDTILPITFKCKGVYLLPIELQKKEMEIAYTDIVSNAQKQRNYVIISRENLLEYLHSQYDYAEKIQCSNKAGITLQFEDVENK